MSVSLCPVRQGVVMNSIEHYREGERILDLLGMTNAVADSMFLVAVAHAHFAASQAAAAMDPAYWWSDDQIAAAQAAADTGSSGGTTLKIVESKEQEQDE
jgi:hypothetical protein